MQGPITIEEDDDELNTGASSGREVINGGKSKAEGAPLLLVSECVRVKWEPPVKFTVMDGCKHVRFVCIPCDEETSSLFIDYMPDVRTDAHIGRILSVWLTSNLLVPVMRENHSGGGTYKPDKSVRPHLPDPNPPPGISDSDTDAKNLSYRRLVVEVEFCNRNAAKLRAVGHADFSNQFTSLFLGINIWKKGVRGFGAIAVLWEKNPTTPVIAILRAVDFGTKAVSPSVKMKFNAVPPAGVNLLPVIPVPLWTRSVLPFGYAPPVFGLPPMPAPTSPSRFTLPYSHILHRVTYRGAPPANPYVLGPPRAAGLPITLDDIRIDLQHFAYVLDTGGW